MTKKPKCVHFLLHFSKEDYKNIGQFEAGFASCLVLKAEDILHLFGMIDGKEVIRIDRNGQATQENVVHSLSVL